MIALLQSAAHSALDPAGPQAARIGENWWLMFWVLTAVYLAVVAVLAAALVHRRRGPEAPGPVAAESGRRMTRVIGGALGATVVILFGLLVHSVFTGRALGSLATPRALIVEVIGRQWWWEVRYQDPVPGKMVTTANEIHIPVGRPVLVRTTSRDVIHSFWVPNLHGKRDLVPGYTTEIWVQADRPGLFRGQCAEFCGLQHAHMAFHVVAEPPERFAAWLAAQRLPAPPPATPRERRGRDLFVSLQCALCHAVQGTDAGGLLGPDLTHMASRPSLAAGTLPNTPAHLGRWIADPQGVKPGARMPPTRLASADLDALVAYLESLR